MSVSFLNRRFLTLNLHTNCLFYVNSKIKNTANGFFFVNGIIGEWYITSTNGIMVLFSPDYMCITSKTLGMSST